MKVTKQMRTETAHRLAGHPGRCQFIHGHSYLWEVSLEGDNLKHGMLVDFSELKDAMLATIDPFDHALILDETDEPGRRVARVLEQEGFAGRVWVVPYRPTAENMAKLVADQIQMFFPQFKVSVKLWETATSYAEATT